MAVASRNITVTLKLDEVEARAVLRALRWYGGPSGPDVGPHKQAKDVRETLEGVLE